MIQNKVIYETNLMDIKLLKRGKVRDIYDLGKHLLLISTDRLSAFDVVFREPIPNKGIVLNKLSEFWFNKTSELVRNHFISTLVSNHYPELMKYEEELKNRSMIVEKTKVIPFEFIVRGHLMGSAYEEYKNDCKVGSYMLEKGLKYGDKLPKPLFTPSTKEEGKHDRNITYEELKDLIGEAKAEKFSKISLNLYEFAYNYALNRGIIIADTKFEFGEIENEIILIDEIFTPDSSRFILKDDFDKGRVDKSLDKQFVRDYLTSIGWNKEPPPPSLPKDVIEETSQRYLKIYELLTGNNL